MADQEKRAASAAPVAGMKPEEATVSPPLKTRKFEKFVDDVPRGGEGTEHLLKIPVEVVREVLGAVIVVTTCRRGRLRNWR